MPVGTFKKYRDFGGVTADQQAEWDGTTPPDKTYKGFVKNSDGEAVPVYSDAPSGPSFFHPDAPGPVPSPGRDFFARIHAEPPPDESPAPSVAAGSQPPPAYTSRNILYGARAGLPDADSGRVGSDQRSWERYQVKSGRLERQTAGMFPGQRPGWTQKEAWGLRSDRLPPGAWDAAAAEANRRNAGGVDKAQDKMIDRLIKVQRAQQDAGRFQMDREKHQIEQGFMPFTLEEKRQGLIKGAQAIEENATPFEPSVIDLGNGTTAMTTSRKSAIPIVKPTRTMPLSAKQRVDFQNRRDTLATWTAEADKSGDAETAGRYRSEMQHLDQALGGAGSAPAASTPSAAAPAAPTTPAEKEIQAQKVATLQQEIAYRRGEIAKGNEKPGPDWMPGTGTHLEKIAETEKQLQAMGAPVTAPAAATPAAPGAATPAAAPTAPAGSAGSVRMRAPDGKVKLVPSGEVAKWQQMGMQVMP